MSRGTALDLRADGLVATDCFLALVGHSLRCGACQLRGALELWVSITKRQRWPHSRQSMHGSDRAPVCKLSLLKTQHGARFLNLLHGSDREPACKGLSALRQRARFSCTAPCGQTLSIARSMSRSRSGRALVHVMKAAEHGRGPHVGCRFRFDRTRDGGVPIQGGVAAAGIVVGDVTVA